MSKSINDMFYNDSWTDCGEYIVIEHVRDNILYSIFISGIFKFKCKIDEHRYVRPSYVSYEDYKYITDKLAIISNIKVDEFRKNILTYAKY